MNYLEKIETGSFRKTKKGKIKKVVIKYYPTNEECETLQIIYQEDGGRTASDVFKKALDDLNWKGF